MICIPFLFQTDTPLSSGALSVPNIALYGAFCFAFVRLLRPCGKQESEGETGCPPPFCIL